MKIIIILATLAAVALGVFSEETYNSDYDKFDIQELLQNVRLLVSYGKCFLYEGPCTPYGVEFRRLMPEAIRTSCSKCSPKQRQLLRTVIHTFRAKLPKMFDELAQKEDPKGEYKKSFDNFLKGSE